MIIEIDSNDMFSVLVRAGIEENDAKAIIYDLIHTAQTTPNQKVSIPRAQRLVPKQPPAPPPVEEPVYSEAVQAQEPVHEEFEEDEPAATRIRTVSGASAGRRPNMNFSAFGGPAPPIRK